MEHKNMPDIACEILEQINKAGATLVTLHHDGAQWTIQVYRNNRSKFYTANDQYELISILTKIKNSQL